MIFKKLNAHQKLFCNFSLVQFLICVTLQHTKRHNDRKMEVIRSLCHLSFLFQPPKIVYSHMKKVLTLLASALMLSMSATAADGYRSITITLNNGQHTVVDMTDNLSASFTTENLVVTGTTADLEIPRAQLKSFTFGTESTGVSSISVEESQPLLGSDKISFNNLPDNTPVVVFNAAGQTLYSATVSGNYEISLSNLPKGVVIINVSGNSYKLILK